jgi:stearoyl-CoA desaturase (delta-9 desaturase)
MQLLQDLKQGFQQLKQQGFKLNPVTTAFIAFTHVMAFLSPLAFMFAPEGFASVMLWYFGGYMVLVTLSVTGYTHRLISHKAAKKISLPVHIFWGLMLQTMSCQRSVVDWSGKHVVHHAKVDDPEFDPYGVTNFKTPLCNFLWSHIGAHLYTHPLEDQADNPYAKAGNVIMRRHPILGFQKRFYTLMIALMAGVVPATAGFLIGGSWWTAVLMVWTTALAITTLYHITWTVNSLSHMVGDDKSAHNTARNVWWNLLPLGEGNRHADHHDYACNYCNGFDKVSWLPWLDPTRYMLLLMWTLGLVKGLKRPSKAMVERIYAERRLAEVRQELRDDKWQTVSANIEARKKAFIQKVKAFYALKEEWKAEFRAKKTELKLAATHQGIYNLRAEYADLFVGLEDKLNKQKIRLKDLIHALKAQERERLNRARMRMEQARNLFYESLATAAAAA